MLSFRYTVSHGLREVFPAVQLENRFFFFVVNRAFCLFVFFFSPSPFFVTLNYININYFPTSLKPDKHFLIIQICLKHVGHVVPLFPLWCLTINFFLK